MSDILIGGKAPSPWSGPIGGAPETKKAKPGGFGAILEGMVKDAHDLQTQANQMITKVQTEESGSIHEVMIAMEKADISFRTMMQVRNKLLEAYQEVMRLQI